MSLAGKLEDVALADVMQFIHLGRRTGTLFLERDRDSAEINFHRGAIVGARSPSSRRLGELLIEEGLLSSDDLVEALRRQREEVPRRSLGQILFTSGAVDVDIVRDAIRKQIERTIYELVLWTAGSFVFELDTLRPVDDVAIFPGDLIPDIDLDTQMVLLESARIFDERNRPERLGSAPAEGATHDAAAAAARLAALEEGGGSAEAGLETLTDDTQPVPGIGVVVHLVLGSDTELAEALEERMASEGIEMVRVAPSRAGRGALDQPSPIVVFELLPGETSLRELDQICRRRTGLPVIAILDDISLAGQAYGAGAAAVVPRDLEAILGCLQSMARFRGSLDRARSQTQGDRRGFAKLRRVMADLRSGVFSASVALNLMNVIAESVERAVLFLVRRDHLAALGAFGFNLVGEPLAQTTRGLKLPLDQESALTEAIEAGRALSVPFGEAHLPEDFVQRVGRPENDQIAVFPVLGSDRVILVIYTDNGHLDQPIEEIDIIDLAAAEVGIALENELLRRKLSEK